MYPYYQKKIICYDEDPKRHDKILLQKTMNALKDKYRNVIRERHFNINCFKQKVIKEYYDLEITYNMTNKKGKKWEEIEYYRFRHQECRNKWFDSLLYIWKAIIKGKKLQLNKKTRIYKNTNNFVFLGRKRNGKYANYRRIRGKVKKFFYLHNTDKKSINSLLCSINSFYTLDKKYTEKCLKNLKRQ